MFNSFRSGLLSTKEKLICIYVGKGDTSVRSSSRYVMQKQREKWHINESRKVGVVVVVAQCSLLLLCQKRVKGNDDLWDVRGVSPCCQQNHARPSLLRRYMVLLVSLWDGTICQNQLNHHLAQLFFYIWRPTTKLATYQMCFWHGKSIICKVWPSESFIAYWLLH